MPRALVLAPHTDDAEFGCGGTVAKLVGMGIPVTVLAFSACGDPQLDAECRDASAVLGATVEVLNFQHRRLNEQRQEVLDTMIAFGKKVDPTIVFLPNTDDVHQDHQVVAQEGMRAFKRCTLLGYELPWNSFRFQSSAFSILEERHVQAKCTAMLAYKSQQHRQYATQDYIFSAARFRGAAIGTTYAEAFQSIRQIL